MKALYAYFGEFGYFDENVPGHSFYQIGLISSISEKYGISNFDVLNYIDKDHTGSKLRPIYPDSEIGKLMVSYSDSLIDEYRISYVDVLQKISKKEYDLLFLKARFRNLSTLSRKFSDAAKFESLIKAALAANYDPSTIIILDTDMSMSEALVNRLNELQIPIIQPSIGIPGIGSKFLFDCLDIHKKSSFIRKRDKLVFAGNLDFSNYKEGHSKDPIIREIIDRVPEVQTFTGLKFNLTVCAKMTDDLANVLGSKGINLIPREDRVAAWSALTDSIVSINVSKDIYLRNTFTPARVYEALIAGIIPVSYKESPIEALTFYSVDDFFEICTFLSECTPADYYKVFESVALKFIV